MERKITASLFYMGLIAAVVTIVLSAVTLYGSMGKQAENDLKITSSVIAAAYDGNDAYMSVFDKYDSENLRVTLINPSGDVLYDNTAKPAKMGNHLDRPEIRDAAESGSGFCIRDSSTLSGCRYYYAQKLTDGNYLRLSVENDNIYENFAHSYPYLFIILILLCAASIIISMILTKILIKPIKRLANDIDSADVDENVYKEILPFIKKIHNQRTENRRNLAKIEAEKNRLSSLVQNMTEGFILFDNSLHTILINNSARRFLNCGNPLEIEEIKSLVIRAQCEDKVYSELVIDGCNYNVSAEPIAENGVKTGIMCLMLDVTERSKVEKIKRDFTANVSHELKTPLTSISGYSEMIMNGMAKKTDISKFAGIIYKESQRLLTLISDIIKLSELDEAQAQRSFEMINLLEVADECAQIISTSAEKKNIKVSVQGEGSFVKANRHLLFEMIYNICDNAVRYNKENGSIEITVGDKQISVKDSGIGIPEKYLQRIFERFYRVDKSRSKATGGTGLGLSIVKHTAEIHNAQIEVKSEENIGTTVTVRF